MATQTPNKNLTVPAHNEFVNTWDTAAANPNYQIIDTCFSGTLQLNATGLSGTQALTQTNVQPPTIQIAGAPTAAITYTVPAAIGGLWIVRNTTTGGFAVGIASAAGGGTVIIPAGSQLAVWCDGTATGMLISNSPVTTGLTVFLLNDVGLNNPAVFFNGPSTGSIGAVGQVWAISGTATIQDGSAGTNLEIGIFDGTNYIANTVGNTNNNFAQLVLTLPPVVVTLGAATTFTIRVKDASPLGNLLTTAGATGTANKATYITAVRLS